MKSKISLQIIALTVVLFAFACKSGDDKTPTDANISLTVSSDNIALFSDAGRQQQGYGIFTVNSDIGMPHDVEIDVYVSTTGIISVSPETVIMAKGTKTVRGTFMAEKEGDTVLSISCDDAGVELVVESLKITVEEREPQAVLFTPLIKQQSDDTLNILMHSYESSDGYINIGRIWTNDYAWGNPDPDTGPWRICIDNYGCPVVGTRAGNIVRAVLVSGDGVAIDASLDWVENLSRSGEYLGQPATDRTEASKAPEIFTENEFTENAGKTAFIVGEFYYRDLLNGVPANLYAMWIKVTVSAINETTGMVAMSVQDARINLNKDASFVTGQTQ